jgi:hypothetical protein
VERELLTLPEYLRSSPVFSGFLLARPLVFCVVFCRWLFVLFVWPLYCLSFDLQLLITSLASSSFSYPCEYQLSVKKNRLSNFWDKYEINLSTLTTVSWYKTSLTSTLLVWMSLNCFSKSDVIRMELWNENELLILKPH